MENLNQYILTKASEKDPKFCLDCKALVLIHSGKVGENNLWKKEFLCSYKAGDNSQYLKKGVFSLFTIEDYKNKNIIQTGKSYHIEAICNAKKAKNHWVNNLDIVSIEEIKEEEK